MKDPDAFPEARAHPGDHLRRERDLRHQEDGARAVTQGSCDQLQVDLGFAGACYAPQQAFGQTRLLVGGFQLLHRALLLGPEVRGSVG